MKRLILIDGNAILHRAFHALPPLTAPDGSLVNAVYGFSMMLFKIVHDLKPTHLAVAFDRPKPTFRKEMFKEYQAHRPKMDDDLVPQVDKVHELLKSFGISIFEMDGYEADDVIGTLARKAERNGIDQVIIVTGDRDIMQLVNDKVMVYMPVKGVTDAKLYAKEDVKERLGVYPEQVPDFKALAGDSSDNYPGVAGIGPKTAAKLLDEFGNIEELYRRGEQGNWGNTGDTVKEKLLSGKESARLSHDLATIRTDVPVETSWDRIKFSSLDTPAARDMLEDLHFYSLLRRLANNLEPVKKETKKEARNKKKTGNTGDQQTLF